MPRIECSVQLSTHCEGWWDQAPAPDPDRAPICRHCHLLLVEAMASEYEATPEPE